MRRKHLTVDEEDTLTFSFQGKSGKQREVEIENDELVALIKKSSEMPGYEIFRYATKDGVLESVDSDEVNAFIHEQMGEDFSSKDFRTWVAGRLAVEYYPMALVTKMSAPRKKFSNILIRMVADSLGNTPTVCKDYYVHPAILEKVDRQTLPIVPPDDSGMIHQADLSPAENIVLEVIEDY